MADSDEKDSPINDSKPGKRKKQKLDLELLDKGTLLEDTEPLPATLGEYILTMRSRLLRRLGLRDDVEYDPDPFEEFYSQFEPKVNSASDDKEASPGD